MVAAHAELAPRLVPNRALQRPKPKGRLLYGVREFNCPILALSSGGAHVQLVQPIGIWSTVTLAIDGIGSLHCRVVWQRGDTVALQFVQNAQWVNGKILAAAS